MANRDIIAIGASAGGVEALMKLVAKLPEDLPASVFIVVHMAPNQPSALAELLSRAGPLPAENAADRQEIERGHIYLAPPDHHLLIDRSYTYITRGPRENMSRPSVDPLFRSAAVVHGPHVVGTILSGTLDDGSSGLLAVKRCGGVTVVQDPEDALYPDMPQSALDIVEKVDHCVGLADMAELLADLAHGAPGSPVSPPMDILAEVEIARTASNDAERLNEFGRLVPLTCAECGGPLWQMTDDRVTRFRCREGHSYTAKSLAVGLSNAMERSLWVAVQTMDERVRVLQRLASYESEKGRERSARDFMARAEEALVHAERVRQFLLSVNTSPQPAVVE